MASRRDRRGRDKLRFGDFADAIGKRGRPEQADAQAFLFYCFIFGQSLLFLERGPRKRAQLIARSAEKLLDDQP